MGQWPRSNTGFVQSSEFLVLDGEPAMPHERGLKDTVLVDPGSAVPVITEFADFADPNHLPLSQARARGCGDDGPVRGRGLRAWRRY
jgi:hypothetical protein